jgi:cysteine-rich repeat protein
MLRSTWFAGLLAVAVGACSEGSVSTRSAAQEAQVLLPELEPNDDVASATPLGGPNVVHRGMLAPEGDGDYYSFTGGAGDRVYVAVVTTFNATGGLRGADPYLTLLGSDGTTVIEEDDDDGSYGGLSSSIAGAVLPSGGTYYLKVEHVDVDGEIRPYDLHFQLRSGTPTAEVEPNDAPDQAQPLTTGWIVGSVSAAADADWYAIELDAGDTLFVSLDGDPERDGTDFNGRIAIAPFANFLLPVNDAGGGPGPDSEAQTLTVRADGVYFIRVDSGASPQAPGTYGLSVSVHPARAATCQTYTSTTVVTIPAGPGTTTATINVPDDIVIGDLDVSLVLNHANPPDLDVHLLAPGGNRVGLFKDIGTSQVPNLDVTLDDEAALYVGAYSVIAGMTSQPMPFYRLHWFDGQQAQGTWTLELNDDAANAAGQLTSWGLTICPAAPPPACGPGMIATPIFTTDFEDDDAGFTSSGAANEWARGTPSAAPFTTCNSGTSCFKTDLTGDYDADSSQDLVSPAIDLTEVSGPIVVQWAQKYSMEHAQWDHAWVEVRDAATGDATRLWEFADGTMSDSIRNPATTVIQSAGWGVRTADASDYAGGTIELVFHVDSDDSVHFPGLAIDDVTVFGCVAAAGCGNGIVEPGEVCDDNNTTSGDGCSADCLSDETCGNDIVDVGEMCDDGNTTAGDGCNADCSSDETCPNGVVDPGEACDDGNDVDGDGCEADCTLTPGPKCGNGEVEEGEVCDDGNTTSGDGCSADCLSDETCGNGLVDTGEACDDGNDVDGDGCEADCTVTPAGFCGDGTVDDDEECDDGNNIPDDGCEADCTETPTGGAVCGNGAVEQTEQCDDGNTTSGDGCSSTCRLEPTESDSGCCSTTGRGAAGNGLLALGLVAVGLIGRRRARRR